MYTHTHTYTYNYIYIYIYIIFRSEPGPPEEQRTDERTSNTIDQTVYIYFYTSIHLYTTIAILRAIL